MSPVSIIGERVFGFKISYFFMALVGAIICTTPSYSGNAQISRLMTEKQQKLEQLEQCTKKVTGFKVAGISTLGLTAVGIGGNIALASKEKGLEYQIEKRQNELSAEQTNLNSLNSQIGKIETEKAKQDCDAKGSDFVWLNNTCVNKNEIKQEENKTAEEFTKMEITRIDTLKSSDMTLPENSALSDEEITKRMQAQVKSTEKDLKQQQKKNAECKKKNGENYWWNGKKCVFASSWDNSVEVSRMEVSANKLSLPAADVISDKELDKDIHNYIKSTEKDLKQQQKELRKKEREEDRLEKQNERQELREDNKLDRQEDKNDHIADRAAAKAEKELEKAEKQCDKRGDDWYWNGKECIAVAKPSGQEVVRSYGASGTNYGIDGRNSISGFMIEAH